jgi:hypothetical protein
MKLGRIKPAPIPAGAPEAGETWQHVDGDLYTIVRVGYDEMTLQHVVGYDAGDGTFWVRRLPNFLERFKRI